LVVGANQDLIPAERNVYRRLGIGVLRFAARLHLLVESLLGTTRVLVLDFGRRIVTFGLRHNLRSACR
jgi:hypothetical protein